MYTLTRSFVFLLHIVTGFAIAGVIFGWLEQSARLTNISLQIVLVAVFVYAALYIIFWMTLPPHYAKAYKAYKAGNLSKALEYSDKSVQARPESQAALVLRMQLYVMSNQLDKAKRDVEYYFSLDPDSWYGYWYTGQCYYYEARYEEAIEAYLQAVQRNPKSSLPYCSAGVTYYRLGKYENAIQYLRRATTMKGEIMCKFSSHYYLGRSLEELGEEEQADKAFAKMTKYSDGLIKVIENSEALPNEYEAVKLLKSEV